MPKDKTGRFKAHTIYKNSKGIRLPSVTGITGLLDKSRGLVIWANNLGLDGLNADEYRNAMAAVGRLTHARILEHYGGPTVVMSDFAGADIALSDNAMRSFLSWEKGHIVCPEAVERPLVSEVYQFGGTPDLVGTVDGVPSVIDFKTGNDIYPDVVLQLVGYWTLVEEVLGLTIERTVAVNINRENNDSVDSKQYDVCRDPLSSWMAALEALLHLRDVWHLKKQLGIR